MGLFALLLGGIPIWPTNLRIELFFPWDRFTLPMMLGASLLLVGLFELIGWRAWLSILLVSLAAGLGAGLHYQNALEFRKDWLMQRDFFWQLTWRAPQIKPGTVLLTSDLPFPYDWDNSLIAPLNWTYAPQLQGRELPYLIYNAEFALEQRAARPAERLADRRGPAHHTLQRLALPDCAGFLPAPRQLCQSHRPAQRPVPAG